MRKRSLADVHAEYAAALDRLMALNRAMGVKPWQPPVQSGEWANPFAPGTPDHAAAEEVQREALKLDHRILKLGFEVDRRHSRELDKRLRQLRKPGDEPHSR